ncbi:hypothetical protein Q7P37_007354 [Cladosporium fusiforme]
MSLAFIKALIFPRQTFGDYSPLPQHHVHNPTERPSQDSISSSSTRTTVTNEKSQHASEPGPSTKANSRLLADATLGLSDGLTVPFALTAGLSALGDTQLVINGGLAELTAGAISMGLGGFLAARSEAAGYRAALAQSQAIVGDEPERAMAMVMETFGEYGFPDSALDEISGSLVREPEKMVEFLMRFCHGLAAAEYTAGRAIRAGLMIAAGYFFGGMVPLLPYLLFESMHTAFVASVVVMTVALFAFGWVKAGVLDERSRLSCASEGMQMILMGGLAAGAAMGCVQVVGG